LHCFILFVDSSRYKHSYKALTKIELEIPKLVKEMEDKISGLSTELITCNNSLLKNLYQCVENVEKIKSSIDKKLVNQVFITHCIRP